MASPQTENGFTRIANEILERLVLPGINGSEFRILLFVIRKTYGFNKIKDRISLSQYQKGTSMNRAQVVETIKELVHKRILVKEKNVYRLNKNWEEWVVCKRIPVVSSIKYKWPRKCAVCGFGSALERHHIIPRNEGGTDDFDNLVVLCANHHSLADSGQISREDLQIVRKKSVAELGGSMQNENPSMQKHTKTSMQKHTHKRKKDNNTKDIELAEQAPQDKVVLVIDSFKEVNPSYSKWFGNITQRGACHRLLLTHGEEKVLRVIKLLPHSNKIPFVPTITTPVQLEDKWAALESALIKKKVELQTKTKVAFQ